ncbi:hypothetical protein DYU05_06955 [Mucilaginibacter terrenus]|uniref:Damage-inducible protein DinB n=1 Tax=Mucilaginibacter terrenus TaxID=2482727 RepID=A0A3E2NWI5_9SPHI|nr:DinB family protein [Mucilaginibacter terrenus]RFZ85329.1 hypothetical protein DYU05_06955 [Mucilaginibacter terrenus]
MYTTLLQQYQLILSARSSLFNSCDTLPKELLFTPLPSFNNESIISQLVHVANCYVFWLSNSAMQEQRLYFKDEDCKNMEGVRQAYGQVDLVMNEFLLHNNNSLQEQRVITRPDGSTLFRSPFELFTHVITHEFHHKGQVVNMSRQLGYIPVDTDVIRE